jgi:FkbM family methyltransferase
MRPKSFGLNKLDGELRKYVNFRGGIFVEAGANDGLSQSNTAYFERYLGWNGLLVEPIPQLAARCRANRPDSVVEEYALVDAETAAGSVEMTYCNLMSIVGGARGSADADVAHIESGRQYLASGDNVRKLEVSTATLSSLLVRNGFDRIDLLSLDVEGYEPQALMGLNFAIHAPNWILVEANDPAAVEAVLAGRYGLVAQLSPHDRLYRLNA